MLIILNCCKNTLTVITPCILKRQEKFQKAIKYLENFTLFNRRIMYDFFKITSIYNKREKVMLRII